MRPTDRNLPMLLAVILPTLHGCGAVLLTGNAVQTSQWVDVGDPIDKPPRPARYVEPRLEVPSATSEGLSFTLMERDICPHKVVQRQRHMTPDIDDEWQLVAGSIDGTTEAALLLGYGIAWASNWDKQEGMRDFLITTAPIPLAYLGAGAINLASNRWIGHAVSFEDASCGDWTEAAHVVKARFASPALSVSELPAERQGTQGTWTIPAAALGKIILSSDNARLEPERLDFVAYVETMSLPGAKRNPVPEDMLHPILTNTVVPTPEQWVGWQCAQIATMTEVTPELTPQKIAALLPKLERTCSTVAVQARQMACATTRDVVAALTQLNDVKASTWMTSDAATLEAICGVSEQNQLRAAIRSTYARLSSMEAADAWDDSARGLYADVTRDLADERAAAYGRAFLTAKTSARHVLLNRLHQRLPEGTAPKEWEDKLVTLARETDLPTETLQVLETWRARLPAASRTAIAQLSETALAASDFDAANVVLTKYPNLPDARTYAARMDAMRMGQLSVAQPKIDALLEESSWKAAYDAAVALRTSYGRTPAVATYAAKAILSAEQGAIADTKSEVAEKTESEYWSGIVELTDGLIEQYPGSAPVAAYARAASATARMKIAQEEARERAEAAREAAEKRACYGKCMASVVACDSNPWICGNRCNYSDICPCCTPAPNDCKMLCGTYGD